MENKRKKILLDHMNKINPDRKTKNRIDDFLMNYVFEKKRMDILDREMEERHGIYRNFKSPEINLEKDEFLNRVLKYHGLSYSKMMRHASGAEPISFKNAISYCMMFDCSIEYLFCLTADNEGHTSVEVTRGIIRYFRHRELFDTDVKTVRDVNNLCRIRNIVMDSVGR